MLLCAFLVGTLNIPSRFRPLLCPKNDHGNIDIYIYTVIPRLTSDPANEYFFAVFRARLTNIDSANECFSGCAR